MPGRPSPALRWRALTRDLHPLAWWVWALGLAAAASRTTNPLLLGLVVGAVCLVVVLRRTDAPWALGFAGLLYGTVACVTGAIMLLLAVQVLFERAPAERASRNLFAFSILYLFLLFAVLLVERGWGGLLARLTT